MFHLDAMDQKVVNFNKSVVTHTSTPQSLRSLLWDSVRHIFAGNPNHWSNCAQMLQSDCLNNVLRCKIGNMHMKKI